MDTTLVRDRQRTGLLDEHTGMLVQAEDNLNQGDMEDSNSASSATSVDATNLSPFQIVPEMDGGPACNKQRGSMLKQPFLKIKEEPTDRFRFRYQSEMLGPHGSIQGRHQTNERNKKSCPLVELCNYDGDAVVKCTLVDTTPKRRLHAHKLVVRDQTDDVMDSVSVNVGPSYGGYVAGFEGVGIVHTAKKDITNVLLKKYERCPAFMGDYPKLYNECKNAVREMDLNKVCLRFTAHDPSDMRNLICPPIFSATINNMKAAATGVLKIVDYSKSRGSPRGGDKIYMFVEKVLKKKISIIFFEEDELGTTRVWEAPAVFSELDVHHQYAIVFRTPPYRLLEPSKDVEVFMELRRTTDGVTSQPRPFTYRANPEKINAKRARFHSSLSSFNSLIGADLPSADIIPTTILNGNSQEFSPRGDVNLEQAMFDQRVGMHPPATSPSEPPNPTRFQPVRERVIHFSDEDINQSEVINNLFKDIDGHERSYLSTFADISLGLQSKEISMDFMHNLRFDAVDTRSKAKGNPLQTTNRQEERQQDLYKKTDYQHAEKILQEIIRLLEVQTKEELQSQTLNLTKMHRLYLSNGDSILHMLVFKKKTDMVVALVRRLTLVEAPMDILNHRNNCGETVLHYTVKYNNVALLKGLLLAGCDMMISDKWGNSPVHTAAIEGNIECLRNLLCSRSNEHYIDFNISNNEGMSALLLAVNVGTPVSCELIDLLLEAGTNMFESQDNAGRNVLHHAVIAQDQMLLQHILKRKDVQQLTNKLDFRGHSALHAACVLPENIGKNIVKLLLEAGAWSLAQSAEKELAFHLARDKQQVLELLNAFQDIKEEPKCEQDDQDEKPLVMDFETQIKEEVDEEVFYKMKNL